MTDQPTITLPPANPDLPPEVAAVVDAHTLAAWDTPMDPYGRALLARLAADVLATTRPTEGNR